MGFPPNPLIQVTNVAPSVTTEQLRLLFSNIGPIKNIIVYPTNDPTQQTPKICYIRFEDSLSSLVAQHLTNTVFIDRAIYVSPVRDSKIPDQTLAFKLANEERSQANSNSGVLSQMTTGVDGVQSIRTIDPRLSALGLPQYPLLPASLDPAKIEEIRRTVNVANILGTTQPEGLLDYFTQFGEVKFLRMTSREDAPIKTALVEFTDQSSVANALQSTDATLNGSQIKITHATTSIIKPASINTARDLNKGRISRSRSGSVSRSRHRSPSYHRHRSSRSPYRSSRRRSPSRSPSRERRRRSPSRERRDRRYRSSRRSRSRSPERSKGRRGERDRRRSPYSRDRSVERRHRDKSRRSERDRSPRGRDKERSSRHDRDRERERDHHDRRHSPRHSSHSRTDPKEEVPIKLEKDYENKPEKDYENKPEKDNDNKPEKDYDNNPEKDHNTIPPIMEEDEEAGEPTEAMDTETPPTPGEN